jgi:hypothetical protein
MNVREWQKTLKDNFSHNGLIGGRILPSTMEQERICGAYFIQKFHGHRVLADSFLDFFAVTLRSAGEGHINHGWPAHPYYPICLVEFVTQFRGMRAAELLSVNGYPLDGYALQRNLKDQAICLGAIVVGISSFSALYGLREAPSTPWTKQDQRVVLDRRKSEEKKIFNEMIGKSSGLEAVHLEALTQWNNLFHLQVHGARLSRMHETFAWLQEKKDFAVGPRMDDDGFAMYMNRFTEIAWMTLRSLPFLQTETIHFSDEWQHQWQVLDDALRISVEGLGSLGKKIAPAFIAMIDSKFATSLAFRYVEHGVPTPVALVSPTGCAT